jgi:hypothetical protein
LALQLNGSSKPAGVQSAPQAFPSQALGVFGVGAQPSSLPAARHSPDALQLNGSSEPAGAQSTPHARPEQTFDAFSIDSLAESLGVEGEVFPEQPTAARNIKQIEEPTMKARVVATMPRSCRRVASPISRFDK